MRNLLLLALLLPLASSAVAQEKGLSLEQVLAAARASVNAKELDAKTEAWAEAAFRQAEAELGSWRVEAEGAFSRSEEGERRVGAFVEKSLKLGVDRESLRQQYRSEALATRTELDREARELMLLAGREFLQLLYHQSMYQAAKELLATLDPLLAGADRAAARGQADALSHLKGRILHQDIRSTLDAASAGFKMTASLLRGSFGLEISDSPEEASLIEPRFDGRNGKAPADPPEVKALAAEAKAFASKANAYRSSFELSFGLGIERNIHAEADSLVARVSLPLGQGSINQALEREALAKRELLAFKQAVTKSSFERSLKHLDHEIAAAGAERQALTARRDELKGLLGKTMQGLGYGLTDLAQVLEASEKLFELERSLAEAIRTERQGALELLVLLGDEP